MLSNSLFIHLRAAPMPLESDSVSLKVCLVPKFTRVVMSASILSEETALMISYKRESVCAIENAWIQIPKKRSLNFRLNIEKVWIK